MGEAEHHRPTDDVFGRQLLRQACALRIAPAAGQHGQPQQGIGRLQPQTEVPAICPAPNGPKPQSVPHWHAAWRRA
jgi:hypothetical protein